MKVLLLQCLFFFLSLQDASCVSEPRVTSAVCEVHPQMQPSSGVTQVNVVTAVRSLKACAHYCMKHRSCRVSVYMVGVTAVGYMNTVLCRQFYIVVWEMPLIICIGTY